MELAWTHDVLDARSAHASLAANRRISLSTVQSTLERLHRKRVLTRQKQGRVFVYTAAVAREELIGALVAGLVSELSAGRHESAVHHLLDGGGDMNEHTLQRLERWIADYRARLQADREGS